jgi:hypothetical protein
MDQLQALSELFKDLMTRSAFAAKYRFQYYYVTEAIEKGQITTHCINGQIYISVPEALSVLQSRKRKSSIKAAGADLFTS